MINHLRTALNDFVVKESELLKQDSHVGSITGHLIKYLENSFSNFKFSIDTQYNKRVLDNVLINKEADFLINSLPLNKWPLTWENGQQYIKREILPDIIFHDQQSRDHNYIIIEIKKSTNKNRSDRDWDFVKLSEMTKGELNYRYGVFIDFMTGKEFNENKPYYLTIFEKGDITFAE